MKSFIQICLLAFAAVTVAQAGLVLTWDNPDQTASPGDTVQYTGTLTNDGDATVFLNGDDLNFDGITGLTTTDLFASNAPFWLDAGQSQSGLELVEIVVADPFPSPFTTYSGTYVVQGGLDGGTFDSLTAPAFSLTIQGAETGTDTPEPATFMMAGAGVLALGLKIWGRRRRAV
jgi:hypothetical protein